VRLLHRWHQADEDRADMTAARDFLNTSAPLISLAELLESRGHD
jgi:hypothetical protein